MKGDERARSRPRARRGLRLLLWAGAGLLLLFGAGVAWWTWRFPAYTPLAVAQDLRAATRADTVEEFLALRYGPLTLPGNSRKAFLDFFNPDHLEGLYRVVGLLPREHKPAIIAAMAHWVADYRRGLSPEERETLRVYLSSDSGRATLQRAADAYLRQDVAYRAATAPVVVELMATLAEVKNP